LETNDRKNAVFLTALFILYNSKKAKKKKKHPTASCLYWQGWKKGVN